MGSWLWLAFHENTIGKPWKGAFGERRNQGILKPASAVYLDRLCQDKSGTVFQLHLKFFIQLSAPACLNTAVDAY